MPSRELIAERTQGSRVRFSLRLDGPFSETEVAAELTAILIAADPALDDNTGRLIPGQRQTDIKTSLFLTAPDSAGVSHVGGIECTHDQVPIIAMLAEKRGYRVLRDV